MRMKKVRAVLRPISLSVVTTRELLSSLYQESEILVLCGLYMDVSVKSNFLATL